MSADFGDIRYPTARKPHHCHWCGERILVGERHPQFVGKWEGDFQNWRMHAECYDHAMANDELSDGFSPYEHERPTKDAAVRAL